MDKQDKLFWGLIIENGKNFTQVPKFNFHLSMAVLDLKTVTDNESVQLYVQTEKGDFILCTLNKSNPQTNLDMIFGEGEKIKFYTSGSKCNVHLTGYTMPEDDFGDIEDEEFSDEEDVSLDSDTLDQSNKLALKRKNTETLKLIGKDAKKLKTNESKANEKVQPKIIDVDPKQLIQNNKKQDGKLEQKKTQPQANQQKKNKPLNPKLATKGLNTESDSDDDLSVDDDESVDLNNLQGLMDEDSDEDLEFDDDDLESDDEDEVTAAKMKELKNKKDPILKKNMQNDKPQQNKPNQQKKQNVQLNKPGFQQNKTPQQQNKSNQNTPFNKNQKNQQTPFNKNQNSGNKNQNNSNKKGTPFQHKNKSFGSQNKQAKKVFS